MTLDMANFSIGVIKPDIVACSVEYEKNQFKHMLETQPGKAKIPEILNPVNKTFQIEQRNMIIFPIS